MNKAVKKVINRIKMREIVNEGNGVHLYMDKKHYDVLVAEANKQREKVREVTNNETGKFTVANQIELLVELLYASEYEELHNYINKKGKLKTLLLEGVE